MRTVLIAAGVVGAILAAGQTRGTGVAGTLTPSVRLHAASPQTQAQAELMRFRAMDTNRDGVISRAEWRGSAQSFRVHDWNGDGVLSAAEVREAARAERTEDPDYVANNNVNNDWSVRHFRQLDHDANGRLTRQEWHYDREAFVRADRNRDGALTQAEFVGSDFDDDRGDQFDYLDLNGNGRIERNEWHASPQAFQWLDRDGNGVLSRAEVAGTDPDNDDDFASIDINGDRAVSLAEWHWSQASFRRLDRNGDGRLTRNEFEAAGPFAATATSTPILTSTPLRVNSTDRWTDTGIYVRAGDVLTFRSSGSITMSGDPKDIADPAGARSGRHATDSLLPQALAGALLARIGTSEPMLVGGGDVEKRATTGGRLYLGVNDDHLPDNVGAFNVTVSVRRPQ